MLLFLRRDILIQLCQLLEGAGLEAEVLLKLVDAIHLNVHGSRTQLDCKVSLTAVDLSLIKTSRHLANDIRPIGEEPVQPRESPTDTLFVFTRLIEISILVQLLEHEIANDVLGDGSGPSEDECGADGPVDLAGSFSTEPDSHPHAVLLDEGNLTPTCFRRFQADGPRVHLRDVHLIHNESPRCWASTSRSPLRKSRGPSKLELAVDLADVVPEVFEAG